MHPQAVDRTSIPPLGRWWLAVGAGRAATRRLPRSRSSLVVSVYGRECGGHTQPTHTPFCPRSPLCSSKRIHPPTLDTPSSVRCVYTPSVQGLPCAPLRESTLPPWTHPFCPRSPLCSSKRIHPPTLDTPPIRPLFYTPSVQGLPCAPLRESTLPPWTHTPKKAVLRPPRPAATPLFRARTCAHLPRVT